MAPRMTRRGFVAGVLGAVGVAALGKSVAAESPEAEPEPLLIPRELTVDGWDLSNITITINGVGHAENTFLRSDSPTSRYSIFEGGERCAGETK